jgi:hypothetical protein
LLLESGVAKLTDVKLDSGGDYWAIFRVEDFVDLKSITLGMLSHLVWDTSSDGDSTSQHIEVRLVGFLRRGRRGQFEESTSESRFGM